MLWLQTNQKTSGTMNLGGSMTRQKEEDGQITDSLSHIVNIGRLVEQMENRIRSSLNDIYFGKTNDIFHSLRSINPNDSGQQDVLKEELRAVLERNAKIRE